MTVLNSNAANHTEWSSDDAKGIKKQPHTSTRRAILILVGIFLLSVAGLFYLYKSFPELEDDEVQYIKLPMDIEDAKNLGKVLAHYKDRYYFTVLFAFFLTYILILSALICTSSCLPHIFLFRLMTTLQSFAIPGSIFLSILSGFLYPFPLAIFLVCTCSALGASFCYLLSSQLGRKIVRRFFPARAAEWSRQVNKHHSNLLNYIIFLRITPFLPNWFINITSPVIGVPAKPFILGTFIGVAPPSFVMIQAGTTLQQLTSSKDAISATSIIMLTLLAVLSLLPIVFKKKLREKLN